MVKIDVRKADKVNGEWALYVSFPYNQELVDYMRQLPSRFWHPDSKEWEVPLKKMGEIVENCRQFPVEIHSDEYIPIEKKKAVIPPNFAFKTKPYEHQVDGFNFGMTYDRWLLGDEMGLGKTKQVIDIAIAKKLQYNYSHCLIICGVNGLKWNWREEIKIHSDEDAWILGQRVKGHKLKIGSNADKLADVKALSTGQIAENYFIITNVETLRNENIIEELQKLCKDGTIGMIAFDECHKAKNPQSQQGKGILKLQADTMIAITGTPLMNNPMDLYIILKWLGYEKHKFGAFKKHYAEFGGYGGYEIVGYKHLNELQERLDDIMLRRKKEEVLDLPEKTYINEKVEMTPKQAQIYKEISMEIQANIDMIKTAPNPLAELIRMRQATGYTGILSSTIKESAKLDRMEELVEEAVENGKKVVIFSNWTQMTNVIYDRLHKYGALMITGETADKDRMNFVNAFQTNPDRKVIIGTIGAMGTGLTLTAGTVEIFMDEPWNMALKEQCVDRCHRIGQKNNLTIYTLLCEDTIDERIHEIVEKKGVMADAIVDGKITGNKEQLLDFLLS